MNTTRSFTPVIVSGCLICMLACIFTPLPAYSQNQLVQQGIERLRGSMRPKGKLVTAPKAPLGRQGEPASITTSQKGYLRHLGAPASQHFPVTLVVPGKPGETAKNFIRENVEAIGAQSALVDFAIKRTRKHNSRDYVRLRQTYAGLRVFAAEVVIQLNDEGGVEFMLSDISTIIQNLDTGALSIHPLLSEKAAGQKAINKVRKENPGVSLQITPGELKIFDPAVLGSLGEVRPVWELYVTGEGRLPLNEKLLVDAGTGDIVRHYPGMIPLDRKIYDANNQRLEDPGDLEREEGDPPSAIDDVNAAYDLTEDIYAYYFSRHNRSGFDGSDALISVTTRYCDGSTACPFENAFYRSSNDRLYFGEGWTVDDMVGHEYTHAVTHYESGLIYENHAGAINESLSDVFGEFVDLLNDWGTDTVAVRWQLGEDLPGGAIRFMDDPPLGNDPDRMGHPLFVQPVQVPDSTNDYGGVHTNSGVNNKLAYLLVMGDTFNGRTIAGMDIHPVSELYYEANLSLSPTSDYYDLYIILRHAAISLGWSDSQRNNLYNACMAVEIVGGFYQSFYVDWAQVGPENGTISYPFNTVIEAYNAASAGDRIFVKPGAYPETIGIEKPGMLIQRWGDSGSVVIGSD